VGDHAAEQATDQATDQATGPAGTRGTRSPVVVAVEGLAIATRRRQIGPFDLVVGAGEVVGLVGVNGSGKTSCLRLALGLDPASAGSTHVYGAPVSPWRPPVGVGLVLEADGCYPWLSGRDNLRVFAAARGCPPGEVEARLAEAGLAPAADRPVRSYSRGMRQRLAIARARLGDPPLLVLDEPTVALDESATTWLVEVLGAHVAGGGSVLVASHDPTFLDDLGARRIVIDRGRSR
jgi:ABC-type multidrug transport system ATPase subunit